MTCRTKQHKEVEDGVYVFNFMEAVEYCSCDVCNTLAYNPKKYRQRHGIVELLHCNDYCQAHKDIAHSLKDIMFLEAIETQRCAHNGTQPTECEDSPTPLAYIAHCNERYGRIATGDVPIDCRVIELAERLAPLVLGRAGVIKG